MHLLRSPSIPIAALLALALPASLPVQAATALGASVQIGTGATAGGQTDGSTLTDVWSAPFSGLRAEPYASVQDGAQLPGDPDGVTSAATSASVLADWTHGDASAGTVVVNAGWTLDSRDRAASAWVGGAGPVFSYRFTAAGDESLQVAYAHAGSTLIGWNLQVLGGPEGTRTAASAGGSGSFSALLSAGASYELQLVTTGGSFSVPMHEVVSDSARAQFDWQIAGTTAPVPEPASAALWLAGLGLVAGLRRRRHAA